MLDAGDLAHASTGLCWVALLKLERGDPADEAEALVEQAAGVTSSFDVLSVALLAAGRGMVATQRGDHETARVQLDEAIRVCDTSDQLWQQADIRRWAGINARLAGDRDLERRLLTEARERYLAKGLIAWERAVGGRLLEL